VERKMKVFVAGCQGMLARDLLPRLRTAGLGVHGFDLPELDITRYQETIELLREVGPGLVINCAAYTAVDKAESEPQQAFAVNRDGPANLAAACADLVIPLIHISTDYVFDGRSNRPYEEDDSTNPLGVYGQSKWEGEETVRSTLPEHLIVRTSWLFGVNGNNFVKTILRLARERSELKVVADQHGCPTWTGHLAGALVALATKVEEDRLAVPWGTYHYRGVDPTTWYGFACSVVELGRAREALRAETVRPIPTEEFPTPARRPKWSVLHCGRIQRAFGLGPEQWKSGLEVTLDRLCYSGEAPTAEDLAPRQIEARTGGGPETG
jgi:dTDP-4-dehydrorhamnose reductase